MLLIDVALKLNIYCVFFFEKQGESFLKQKIKQTFNSSGVKCQILVVYPKLWICTSWANDAQNYLASQMSTKILIECKYFCYLQHFRLNSNYDDGVPLFFSNVTKLWYVIKTILRIDTDESFSMLSRPNNNNPGLTSEMLDWIIPEFSTPLE